MESSFSPREKCSLTIGSLPRTFWSEGKCWLVGPAMNATMPMMAPPELDLVEATARALSASAEPLTPRQVRAALPEDWRGVALERLEEVLSRQAAAGVFVRYPKYR